MNSEITFFAVAGHGGDFGASGFAAAELVAAPPFAEHG